MNDRTTDIRALSKNRPLIFEIKGNSLDDGPGIRTVIFFKGCPLSCVWCHNPESKRREREISHDAKKCIRCDACAAVCPRKALSRDNPHYIDRERCTLCGACIEACPTGALSIVGRDMTVEEIVRQVEKDVPFFKNSGGGATLSGGEATLFMEFSAALAAEMKKRGIRVLLETCGFFNLDSFMDRLYPSLDTIYFDLKLHDEEAHRRYCGRPNGVILENFRALNRKRAGGGIEVLPRIPLIPGITDTDENLDALARFLREQGVSALALLQNNPLWFDKTAMLGREPEVDTAAMRGWTARERIARIKEIFTGFDIR